MMYNQVKKTWAKQSVALDVRPLIIYDFYPLLPFSFFFTLNLGRLKFTKLWIVGFEMNK